MIHYLALVWDRADAISAATARSLLRKLRSTLPTWKTVIDLEGLAVCCEIPSESPADPPHVLPGDGGVVLGRLFDRRYADQTDTHAVAPARVRLDERISLGLLSSSGERLVRDYWGAYVAFLRDGECGTTWVLRDPTGSIPCHHTSIAGVDVYFRRLVDCERLAPTAFTINRQFLIGYLVYSSTAVRQTALNEVEVVLPGERIEHRRGKRSQSFVWNPIEFARTNPLEEVEEVTRLLRTTVRACVHAWASCFDGILHLLSGGLDSSIVLACLANAPTTPQLLCRHDFDPDGSADERALARLAARRADVELVERTVTSQLSSAASYYLSRTLYPVGWPLDLDDDRAQYARLRSQGFSAEFSGHGGDEVFFRGGSIPAAVDWAWLHGISPRLLSLALDDAVLGHSSIWAMLSWVWRYGIRRRRWHMRAGVPRDHRTLMPESIRRQARKDTGLWHPLFTAPADVPPGKFEHAYLLAYSTGCSDDPLREGAPAAVFPLLSQPMLELSLRTPLYVLRHSGRDRAAARQAFAADVPAEIIARSSKSFGTERARALVVENRPFIRDVLLDGFLVSDGLLDRRRLEEALSGRVSRIKAEALEILDYMSVETWARNWLGPSTPPQCDRVRLTTPLAGGA